MPHHHTNPSIVPGSPAHRRLVTGSKISAIVGLSPWQSPAAVWAHMTGRVAPDAPSPAMRRGHNQESAILDWFFTELHPELEQQAGETTWTRPDMPWAAANTDAHATTPDGDTVFVEAKSIARDTRREWGQPGTDEVPVYYAAQVIWQMHMTHGEGGAHVTRTWVVKHGPYVDQYDTYLVNYDPQVAAMLTDRAGQFHTTLTDPHGCPPPADMPGEHTVFARMHPDIDDTLDWEISHDLAADYIRARTDKADAQAREDGAKARILQAMGEARTATCNGTTVAYRRATKRGVTLYPPTRTITLDDITPTTTGAAATAA